MPSRSIRRGQVIAPFGTGAIVVAKDGTNLIGAGLDHWFEREDRSADIDEAEFRFGEWRLERDLAVDYLALPPDYRTRKRQWASKSTNTYLTIPYLRFPTWHVCPKCRTLSQSTLYMRDFPRCGVCTERPPRLVQVRFIAICEGGHIQDFPWREWVHRNLHPGCKQQMTLRGTGGASLAATNVECRCGVARTLERITDSGSTDEQSGIVTTYLSRNVSRDAEYFCHGLRPWLADLDGVGCGRPVRGSLRGATNVYFAQTKSSIYLPRASDEVPQELLRILEDPPLSTLIRLLLDANVPVTAELLKQQHGSLLRDFTEKQITSAVKIVTDPNAHPDTHVAGDDFETAFRRSEFNLLRSLQRHEQLRSTPIPLGDYADDARRVIDHISLVDKVRETRVFTGFTRVFSENAQTRDERRAMLWRTVPTAPQRWLPAYKVFGEGIFLELDARRLLEWETVSGVVERADNLAAKHRATRRHGFAQREITPRFLLLHTFAHLLMNQLTFECGYGSASLRERLYVSTNPNAPMAGILIYTAAGDSEGTMGGLVRMGKPGYLEPVVRKAIDGAFWCSADPVCMELGEMGGQGPDSCNLAACHNCCLSPETSCEEFNRFLDRGVVVGTPSERRLGYFAGT